MQTSKNEKYELFSKQAIALLDDSVPWYSTTSNFVRLYYETFDPLWVGFYKREKDTLYLGPYHGPLACTKIEWGKGVCGAAAEKGETLVVEDVHQFEGHIACSSLSNSEIVLPVFDSKNELWGVLDIDSVEFGHFDTEDKTALEAILGKLKALL